MLRAIVIVYFGPVDPLLLSAVVDNAYASDARAFAQIALQPQYAKSEFDELDTSSVAQA